MAFRRSYGRSQGARFVPVEEISTWREHPAYLVHTVVLLDYVAAKTLNNSMRAMLTDANTQAITLLGESNSVLSTGLGAQVADLVEMLQRVDAQHGVYLEMTSKASTSEDKD